MRQLVSNRWFALANLVLALICGASIYLFPQMGGWVIVVALLPWLIRITAGDIAVKWPFFVILIGLFIITAALGVWTAYNQRAAWEKFWIIFAAVLIFAALVSQPKAYLGVVAGLVGIVGVIIAVVFILNHDWNTPATDLQLIKRAGTWIMAVQPAIMIMKLQQNFVGGVLAILAPIPFAAGVVKFQQGRYGKSSILFGLVAVILVGLLLSSSRGAWLALVTAGCAWILWRGSVSLSERIKLPYWKTYAIFCMVLLIPVILFISATPGGIVELANLLPGLPSGESRLELFERTMKLIGDFPITGSGLWSFAGLYSQYIIVTPYFLFSYSHNFYLDVILEQGILGGISLYLLILGSAWLLLKQVHNRREIQDITILSEAVLVGFIVMLIHGLIDDPLYGDSATPLLFLLPGLALMLVNMHQEIQPEKGRTKEPGRSTSEGKSKMQGVLIPGVFFIIVLLGVIFYRPIFARWYSNLGAVEMARQELLHWPLNRWNASTDVNHLQDAQNLFTHAMSYNPNLRTALHRQGLIAMQVRDFESAQENLEKANFIDPGHRGIQKSLGYAYVWGGDLEKSKDLLFEIHEAENELGVYSWWWGEQNRDDLAQLAQNMEIVLHELNKNDPEIGVD